MIEKFDLNTIYSTSVDGIHWEYHPNTDDILEKINELIDVVNTFEPKYGHWIDTGSGQECSECGEIQYGYDSYRNYCANCGAIMGEVEECQQETK